MPASTTKSLPYKRSERFKSNKLSTAKMAKAKPAKRIKVKAAPTIKIAKKLPIVFPKIAYRKLV